MHWDEGERFPRSKYVKWNERYVSYTRDVLEDQKLKRRWAHSNMMNVIRYHLMTYLDLFKFMKAPDSKLEEITSKNIGRLSIFDP